MSYLDKNIITDDDKILSIDDIDVYQSEGISEFDSYILVLYQQI